MRFLKFLVLISLLQACSAQDKKIAGVSFVASSQAVLDKHVQPVVNINANYAAIMPFAYISSINDPVVKYGWEGQWHGETFKGVTQYVNALNKHDIQVMIKPQIWVSHGTFTGTIKMTNEDDWKAFETTYSKYILDFAKLAQTLQVPIFCIGTELETFIDYRPEYWKQLIKDVKQVYSGKLTYAANWDEFKRTPFWDNLDYIGVDAYFPVSNSKTPTVAECLEGWKPHKDVLYQKHLKHKKPILFTEFGYRSVDYSGKEPWRSDRSMNIVNIQAQVNTTEALFKTFANESWFAGGFVWKWFVDYENVGGLNNSRFTPQNKPTETILKNYYKNF